LGARCTAGKPFILAIADFHKPGSIDEIGSMTYTTIGFVAIPLWASRELGSWSMGRWKSPLSKIQSIGTVRSRYPSASRFGGRGNISAVLSQMLAHWQSLTAMGVAAGFAAPNHRYFRFGTRYNHEPNVVVPATFYEEIQVDNDEEFWSDELHSSTIQMQSTHCLPDKWITQHFFKGRRSSLFDARKTPFSLLTQ